MNKLVSANMYGNVKQIILAALYHLEQKGYPAISERETDKLITELCTEDSLWPYEWALEIRVAASLARCDCIDVDSRNCKAMARVTTYRTKAPGRTWIVNWEVREYPGTTFASFADEIDSPCKAARVAIAKLEKRGLAVPDNLFRHAGYDRHRKAMGTVA